jgi:putative restriction endonuclease
MNPFSSLNFWRQGDQRAPHKPLLVLLALGELLRGKETLIFEEVEPKLKELLIEFGPPRKFIHPEYPFLRLANDGVWKLSGDQSLDSKREYSKRFLIDNRISGGFTHSILKGLKDEPELISSIAFELLNAHFPTTLHEDILQAVGLEDIEGPFYQTKKRRRDADFRAKVLEVYGYRCAICGYDLRVGHAPVGVEAAHVKWHAAGGPDQVQNGIALCSLHHKLFDFGAFSITDNHRIEVSPSVNGSTLEEHLGRFHNQPIILPRETKLYVIEDFLQWHVREVFKSGYRS